jgi:hypothetical protein
MLPTVKHSSSSEKSIATGKNASIVALDILFSQLPVLAIETHFHEFSEFILNKTGK